MALLLGSRSYKDPCKNFLTGDPYDGESVMGKHGAAFKAD
jgi:hypothetical protein